MMSVNNLQVIVDNFYIMWITLFVWEYIFVTFVIMTYDIKRHQKIVKKHGTIHCNDSSCVGELKITRCKIELSPISGNVRRCEIDIIYKGMINNWGKWMGPKREINHQSSSYPRTWMTTIQRNKEFRRMVRNEVMTYLKYLGVYMPYYNNLYIKKIVWVDEL